MHRRMFVLQLLVCASMAGITLPAAAQHPPVHMPRPQQVTFNTHIAPIVHHRCAACHRPGAVGPFPQAAGAASALSGFLMMLSAFGMGHWLGISMDGSVFPLTNGIWFWGVMTAAVAWGLVWRVRPSQTAS